MELEPKKNKKPVFIVLAIVISLLSFEIIMCFFGSYITDQGVHAWNGFLVPVFMIVGFIPIALGEIAILRALRNKGKRYVILNFIFGLHLIGFPIGIVVMIIYNIVVGIK